MRLANSHPHNKAVNITLENNFSWLATFFFLKAGQKNNSNTLAKTDPLLSPLMALADPLFLCVLFLSDDKYKFTVSLLFHRERWVVTKRLMGND